MRDLSDSMRDLSDGWMTHGGWRRLVEGFHRLCGRLADLSSRNNSLGGAVDTDRHLRSASAVRILVVPGWAA